MPVDYQKIRKENERKYGTEVQHYGKTLSGLHPGRTHFIYEVLQNTEDALKKRGDEGGSRAIDFSLEAGCLIISHHGKPFDEDDVRGICSIARSTKEELSSIGRFGIGFKSVYTFTHRPEIHSRDERFAIESFVFPHLVNERALNPGETKIIIPFDKELADGGPPMEQVRSGLKKLRPRTLLFLRQITKITWSVNGIRDGSYWRQNLEQLTEEACKVRVGDSDGLVEDWIVFAREVFNEGESAGYIELAFALESQSGDGHKLMVQRLKENPTLVVFLPTELKTDLGFIVQGPYHPTPSRESIQQGDAWNQRLIEATAVLLVDALEGLRDLGLLGVSALESLPLDEGEFAEGSLFAPLFQAVKDALLNKPLLPAHNGGHIAGKNAKLGTELLRGLITSEQLAELLQTKSAPGWINADVTLGNAPDLYNYLKNDEDGLGIDELYAHWLIGKLTTEFMARQTDDWVEKLYEGLNRSWTRKVPENVKKTPLLRLQPDGSHAAAVDDNGNLQVYLPKTDDTQTSYLTVKSSVCRSDEALAFLKGLGLREPGLVDDVIQNILPKYGDDTISVSPDKYRADLKQAIIAFASKASDQGQKDLLRDKIRNAKFALAVDAGTNTLQFVHPSEAYWPTPTLKALFDGIEGVLLVDDGIIPGEAHNLLAAAGTRDRLARKRVERELTDEQKGAFRLKVSNGDWTRDRAVLDYTLMGLDALLRKMVSMPFKQASKKSKLLWEALCEFSNRGDSAFNGEYRWYYRREKRAEFPACFVERLRNEEWVPDKKREVLRVPGAVAFADTGWEANPSLAEKIRFPSSKVDEQVGELAKNENIDREVLHYVIGCLKNRNITLTEIQALLSKKPKSANDGSNTGQLADEPGAVAFGSKLTGFSPSPTGGESRAVRIPNNSGGQISQPRPSISITLRTSSDGSSGDGSGDGNQRNRKVEDAAIKLILTEYPFLRRTKYGNPGFDLWEPGPNDKPVQLNEAEDERELEWELGPNPQPKRWIEVKSSAGALSSVALSITQFKVALKKWNAYWLYVVENATTEGGARRIFKIKNPAERILNTIDGFNLSRTWIEQHQSQENTEEG